MPATARFEARINTDVQQLLKRAAILEGRSLSDFVISAALSAAKKQWKKMNLSTFPSLISSVLQKH